MEYTQALGTGTAEDFQPSIVPQAEVVEQTVSDLAAKAFGTFFVERGAAQAALNRLNSGMCLQIVGDSRVIIDGLLGNAQCVALDIRRFLKLAHAALQTLIQTFRVAAPCAQELAQQTPHKPPARTFRPQTPLPILLGITVHSCILM